MDKLSKLQAPNPSKLTAVGSNLRPKSQKGFKYATKTNYRYSNGSVAVMDPKLKFKSLPKIPLKLSHLA